MSEIDLWHVERVTPEEYKHFVPDCRVFFNEPDFTELNKDKADDVFYLILKREDSARFGLIIGKKGTEFRAPFSAPYSYPVSIIRDSNQETIDAALTALETFAENNGFQSIRFIFPPLFYDEHLLSGWINAFYRYGYNVENLDINYALDLKKLNVDEETYIEIIPQKGRKGLRRADRQDLHIIRCETEDEYREAYHIVCIGHESKGFPVKMSFEQLMETMKLVPSDAFIVRKNDTAIVAEFLYHVNDQIVQGIYTGTHPDYMNCNGMNLLTYYTIRYYGDKGFHYLDKAISTENSIPNYGLCNFKESVGCERSLKYTFRKEL